MERAQLVGCPDCDPKQPGYVAAVVMFEGRRRSAWIRCLAECTVESRAAEIARQEQELAQQADAAPAASDRAVPDSAPASPPMRSEPDSAPTEPASERPAGHPAALRAGPAYRGQPTEPGTRPEAAAHRRPSAPPARATAVAAGPRRWPAVALAAGTETAWHLDVDQVPAPVGTKLTDLFSWLGTGLPLRVDRIHPAGRINDGMVCLSSSALKSLGLPAVLPTTDKASAALQAKLAKAAGSVGMEISDTVGPTFQAFRRKGSAGGPKASVRVIVTPWLGQGTDKQQVMSELLTRLATDPHGALDAGTLARRIRAFVADLGIAPGVSAATTSMLLLDAVRPRMEWVQDENSGEWTSHLRDGALPGGDTAVPPAAGARHPLTRDLISKGEAVCEEEDYKWWARPLTSAESTKPWTVAVDVCASYLSVTDSLRLPVGRLEHTADATWDAKIAGLWWCDFTEVETDELLPHPASFHGLPPQGPGWYATPTVAYMVTTYGFDPASITEAYLSAHTVPLLKEWTARIRSGYKSAYATLGLVDGQAVDEFLDAYALHDSPDPDDVERCDALVLAKIYKQIYKSGIGKWADSAVHMDAETWLEKTAGSWQYRPEIRFHIIAAARIAEHRRMRKTLQTLGIAPVSVNVDSKLYSNTLPSPNNLLAHTEAGKPLPGALRMGIAPGSHKHEASIPTAAVVALLADGMHPSPLTHKYGTDGAPTAPAAEPDGDPSRNEEEHR